MTHNRRITRAGRGLWRRMTALLVALCVLLPLCAAHAETVVETTRETVTATGGLTNAEAAEGYINSILYPNFRRPRSANLGAKLTGNDAAIFNILKEKIAAVAAGTLSSTEFTIQFSDYVDKSKFTAEELGVDIIVDDDINDAAVEAAMGYYDFNLHNVIDALLNDYPYEMYWYDKTKGCSLPCSYFPGATGSNGIYTLTMSGRYTFKFTVAKEYSASNAEGTTDFDTSKYGYYKVAAAAEDARSIVSANASGSNYEKLAAYKQAICDRVEYNHGAADDDDTPYGNPWQLIWVFDGDASTGVVCEGYSKAFQYLCDLSTFTGDVSAICATGTMAGGTGEGPHMWNIVTMEDGKNYLVDVTNCDDGSIGSPDYLFMKGFAGNAQAYEDYYLQYSFTGSHSSTIAYVYDDSTLSTFGGSGRLKLSQTDYDPSTSPTPTPVNKWGDNLTWTLDDDGTLTITGTGAMKEAGINERYPWANLPDGSPSLTKVVIGNCVESIADNAFKNCEDLVTVEVEQPSSLRSIGANAFLSCEELSKVALPEGLETLGTGALMSGGALTSLTLPASLTTIETPQFGPNTVISVAEGSRYLELTNGLLIANEVDEGGKPVRTLIYLNPGEVESVTIPDGVAAIASRAMALRMSLKDVYVPDSVKTIHEDAFRSSVVTIHCRGNSPAYAWAWENEFAVEFIRYADTLTLPNDTTTIESKAFANLEVPVNVSLPDNVTYIAPDAFEDSVVLLEYTAATPTAEAIQQYHTEFAAMYTDTPPTPTLAYDSINYTP